MVHNEGNNVAFPDGHAKWLKGTNMYAPVAAYYWAGLPWANTDARVPGF
ncbi:MAG: hypothetical protein HYU66_05705 [Armatimonadetes bacterium]|nr:hypothetical protein [Armatimonadota bacterium]